MEPLEIQAETISQKVRHYLITTMGRTADEASDEEFYRAFIWSLREEIMINWTATSKTFRKKGPRKLYYLSMEYMPGRLLGNNFTNIGAIELVKSVAKRLKRNFHKLENMEPDIGIGNGGLGRLASCFLDSLATLQYPALGYGMRYQYGIFEQELWYGVQVERPDKWLINENPWEFRRDSHSSLIKYGGELLENKTKQNETIYDVKDADEIRALPYDLPIIGYSDKADFSVLTLRLWSTKESPRNFQLQRYNAGEYGEASENTSLTDVLYPNDNHDAGKRVRLKQEYLLVSASLQDIIAQHEHNFGSMKEFGDKVRIQINDTHPALIVADLMHVLTSRKGMNWGEALETTRAVCSYTNHTVLKEALEEWNSERLMTLLPCQYKIIERLNQEFLNEIRSKYPNNEEKVRRMSIIEGGQVKMAHLAIFGSHKVNGVAALHTDILKNSVFKDFHEFYQDKFVNVTNGVTQRRWLLHCNPELADFITKRIGDGWITDFEQMRKLDDVAKEQDSRDEFIAIKRRNKLKLLELLHEQVKRHSCDETGSLQEIFMDETALFDIHIKRIHEYKRQFMNALNILMMYNDLLDDPNSRKIKRFVLFGGKAAPGYDTAKNIIRFIYCLSRKINNDKRVCDKLKVIYVENYNVSKAEVLIPAADLSEQVSTASMEASGTGNMKFSMNGALTIGTDDGANVEMREEISNEWWPFLFGASSEENMEMRRMQSYNPQKVLETNPKIKKAVEMLKNRSLVENDAEHEALLSLYDTLLATERSDQFFVLNDLPALYAMQLKVEDLYQDIDKWTEFAIHNMARMNKFSTDVSIQNYAKKIWDLEKCPPSEEEISKVRKDYEAHDRCNIITKEVS